MPIAPISAGFNRGYVSDIARDQLPPGAAYRMKDWLPEFGARLRGRGGWTFTSPDLNGVSACAALTAVGWGPFPTDEILVMIATNGKVYWDRNFDGVTAHFASSLVTNISAGSPGQLTHPLVWHKNLGPAPFTGGLIVLAPYNASYLPNAIYNSSGIQVVGLGPANLTPRGCVGASYGDYFLLANGDINAGTRRYNRIWVSNLGDAFTWTTGTDFWDSAIPVIIGMQVLRTGILVFGFTQTSFITGDIPPANSNWSEKIVFSDIGCFDARCIAKYEDTVIFANPTGVYMTDGVTLHELTAAAGVQQRWRELVANFDFQTGWTATASIFRRKYIITICDNTGTFVTCHVFDLDQPIAYEFTNITARMFAHKPLGAGDTVAGYEGLYAVPRAGTKIQGYHSMWMTPDVMVDGDGSNVLPQLETPFYKPGGPGQKIFRSARATYDVRSASGSTPSLSVDYATEPTGAYTNAGSLPTTTDEDRQRVDIRQRSRGIALRVTQVGKSGHTSFGEIELDAKVLEAMR